MKPSLKERYDVVVAGGGPAGAVAAKCCAKQGFSVLLVEKDKEIGLPVRCGELVGSRGLHKAIEPDPSWITHTVRAVHFISPSGVRITVPTPEPAYMLNRPRMEKDIALMAARHGADILVRATVTGLSFSKERCVNGVTIDYAGEKLSIGARLVVAADGIESRIAKLAGLNSAITDLNDIGICAQYLVSNIDPEGFPELHFGKNVVPDCYAWMFPKGDGTANLGVGIRAASARKESPVAILNRFMRTRFPKVKPLGLTVGSVPLGLYMDRISADGLLVAGDAARMANCLDGGGITFAMNAARMAGRIACGALADNDVGAKRLSAYDREWRETIGLQQVRTYKLKNAVLKVKDRTIEAAAKALEKRSPSELRYLDLLSLTIKNQPALLLEAVKLFK